MSAILFSPELYGTPYDWAYALRASSQCSRSKTTVILRLVCKSEVYFESLWLQRKSQFLCKIDEFSWKILSWLLWNDKRNIDRKNGMEFQEIQNNFWPANVISARFSRYFWRRHISKPVENVSPLAKPLIRVVQLLIVIINHTASFACLLSVQSVQK